MHIGEIGQFCKVREIEQLLAAAIMHINLLAWAYHRTQSIKLARTIADLGQHGNDRVV
jgi:predicted ATPase with chaperone activity